MQQPLHSLNPQPTLLSNQPAEKLLLAATELPVTPLVVWVEVEVLATVA
jgi:hypothetical protein